jgi:hypothetical protein
MATSGTSTHHRDEEELRWVRRALGGPGTGRSQRYLVRPSLARPEILLPLEHRASTGTAMRRYHDDRSIKQRLVGLAGQSAARLGVLAMAGGDKVALEPFALVEHLARVLGEPNLVAVVSLGPRRRNRKPVLQLLRPDGVSVGFVKVGWSGLTSELITNEGRWLRHVEGRLPPDLRAPIVLWEEHLEQEGGAVDVVVTSPVRTTITSRRRTPLAASSLAQLARIGSGGAVSVAESELLANWRKGPLADAVDLDRLTERHGSATIETGLWHGDLTPWNTATNGGVTAVWDWEFAGTGRPVGFDALHIAFEMVRRTAPDNEQAALDAVIGQADALLRDIPGPPITSSTDAVVDLYLCELLARELRLAGEGWRPEHLGVLDTRVLAELTQRLA